MKQKLKRISNKLKNCSFRVRNILFYQPECSDTKRGLYEYKLFRELNFNFERSICNLFRARSIIHRHYSVCPLRVNVLHICSRSKLNKVLQIFVEKRLVETEHLSNARDHLHLENLIKRKYRPSE